MTHSFTKGVPIDTDVTLSLNSNQVVPSQAAVVAYVNSKTMTNLIVNNQVFKASGTYTPSSGLQYCVVEIVGGGGGGGGGATGAGSGRGVVSGGGGGGEYASGVFSSATIGASKTITIGSGGTAAANSGTGGTGGTTSIGSLMTAIGGSGGGPGNNSASVIAAFGGVGGTGGTGGSYRQVGGEGGIGSMAAAVTASPGYGGSSKFGGGPSGQATVNSIGNAGTNYGTGAGGGWYYDSGAFGGAVGAQGICVITEYVIYSGGTATSITPVTLGGTGNSSAPAYSLICGGTTTTGVFQSVADVAVGQVLVSGGTSALPTFSATPSITSVTVGAGTALGTYVEGTFTPTVRGSGTAGTPTYAFQIGRYMQFNKQVFVQGHLGWSAISGSPTGNIVVGGLPFTSENTAHLLSAFTVVFGTDSYTLTTPSGTIPVILLQPNSTTFQPSYFTPSTGANSSLSIPTFGSLAFSGWYYSA